MQLARPRHDFVGEDLRDVYEAHVEYSVSVKEGGFEVSEQSGGKLEDEGQGGRGEKWDTSRAKQSS